MAKQEEDALIGRTIASKFVIQSFLGGGAMGAVYRARQTALEKTVAIKVMHRELTTDEMFAARFHREAKAASRLDHPNSIRVIDFGEEPDGLLYIAMEYVDGRDLFRVLHDDWPLSPARIIELLAQVLAALAVAHDMGVVHRDLKPENIMVLKGTNDEGREADIVKVCDFGIAKITDARSDQNDDAAAPTQGAKLTSQGLVVGTPEYMSPEQGRGEPLDARSDLYSMGVILYHLLTGRTPFNAESALGIVLKHVTDEPRPPHETHSGVDMRLEAICLKALRKRREDRYQTAREMRADLRAVAEGATVDRIARASTELAMPATLPIQTASMRTDTAPTVSDMPAALTERDAPGPGPLMPSASKVTPLGTAAVTGTIQERRSPLPMVALLVLLAGGGVGAYFYGKNAAHTEVPPGPSAMTSASATVTAVAVKDVAPPSSALSASAHVDDPPVVPPVVTKPTAVAVVTAQKPTVGHAAPPEAPLPAPIVPTAAAPVVTTAVAAPATVTAPSVPVATPTPTPAPSSPAAPAVNPDNAKVVIGAAHVLSGAASAGAVRNTVVQRHGQMIKCYQVAVRRQPNAGSASLHIETDDNGVVREAQFVGMAPGKVGGECIAAHVRGLKIPNVDTGSVSADIPLTFSFE